MTALLVLITIVGFLLVDEILELFRSYRIKKKNKKMEDSKK